MPLVRTGDTVTPGSGSLSIIWPLPMESATLWAPSVDEDQVAGQRLRWQLLWPTLYCSLEDRGILIRVRECMATRPSIELVVVLEVGDWRQRGGDRSEV